MLQRLLATLVVVEVLATIAPSANASGGLDLVWNHCVTEGGASDLSLDCGNPAAITRLYGSIVSPLEVTHLGVVDFVIDLQADSAELPPFWNIVGTVGGAEDYCAPANLYDEAEGSINTCPSLENLWELLPGTGRIPLQWEYIPRFGGPNRGRFVFSLPCRSCLAAPDDVPDVVAGIPYFGFRLDLFTSFADPCPGCTTPVVFVFNQVTLNSPTTASLAIVGPGLVSNCATTFGGGSTPCGATPARNRTWGAIKSLYR